MSPKLFKENIKIEIILTDSENDKSIRAETNTTLLKNIYENHNIDGIALLFSQLYNELTQNKE
jgi:hypothetical protein